MGALLIWHLQLPEQEEGEHWFPEVHLKCKGFPSPFGKGHGTDCHQAGFLVSCQKVDWCSTLTLPFNECIEWAARFGNSKKGIGSFLQRKMELLIRNIIQTLGTAFIRSIKINYFCLASMGLC